MSVKYASECEFFPDDCDIPRSADDECGWMCPHSIPKIVVQKDMETTT